MMRLILIIFAVVFYGLFFFALCSRASLQKLIGAEAGAFAMILTGVVFMVEKTLPFLLVFWVLDLFCILLAVENMTEEDGNF